MLVNERHRHILRQIDNSGSVTISELAAGLHVSEMTIRRDLIELERSHLLKRVHGGAVIASGRSYEPPLLIRNESEQDAKARIGKYAASLVEIGESVAIDIGSTTFELAKNLAGNKGLTIITPSFHIAGLFLNNPDVRVILPGGILRHGEGSLIGPLAKITFENLFVDKLFLAVGGISSQAGCTDYNWEDTAVKHSMIESAKEIIVVTDASKFEVVAFAKICPLTKIRRLVTNQTPPPELKHALEQAGVTVELA